jgi:hypothetical protein
VADGIGGPHRAARAKRLIEVIAGGAEPCGLLQELRALRRLLRQEVARAENARICAEARLVVEALGAERLWAAQDREDEPSRVDDARTGHRPCGRRGYVPDETVSALAAARRPWSRIRGDKGRAHRSGEPVSIPERR